MNDEQSELWKMLEKSSVKSIKVINEFDEEQDDYIPASIEIATDIGEFDIYPEQNYLVVFHRRV